MEKKKETFRAVVAKMEVGSEIELPAEYTKRLSRYQNAKAGFPDWAFRQKKDGDRYLLIRKA